MHRQTSWDSEVKMSDSCVHVLLTGLLCLQQTSREACVLWGVSVLRTHSVSGLCSKYKAVTSKSSLELWFNCSISENRQHQHIVIVWLERWRSSDVSKADKVSAQLSCGFLKNGWRCFIRWRSCVAWITPTSSSSSGSSTRTRDSTSSQSI